MYTRWARLIASLHCDKEISLCYSPDSLLDIAREFRRTLEARLWPLDSKDGERRSDTPSSISDLRAMQPECARSSASLPTISATLPDELAPPAAGSPGCIPLRDN